MQKRGLTHQEAIDYIGIKRRTFDEVWRPRLIAMRQGTCLIFDRQEIDKLFDEFKAAAGEALAMPTAPHSGDTRSGTASARPAARSTLTRDVGGKTQGFDEAAAAILAGRKEKKSKR